MPDAPWKRTERKMCEGLGLQRTPLSGSRSGYHTSGDCRAPDEDTTLWPLVPPHDVYVELKRSGGKRPAAVLSLFRDAKSKATKEKRRLVIVGHHEGGTRLRVATVDWEVLLRLLAIARDAGKLDEVLS